MWNVDTEFWPGYETIHTNLNETGISRGILILQILQCHFAKCHTLEQTTICNLAILYPIYIHCHGSYYHAEPTMTLPQGLNNDYLRLRRELLTKLSSQTLDQGNQYWITVSCDTNYRGQRVASSIDNLSSINLQSTMEILEQLGDNKVRSGL